jgi:hypothetical protein
MTAIQDLEPKSLWKHFEAIAAIPRASGKEAAAREYVLAQAARLGLPAIQDKAGNVIVRKPARPGREGAASAALQGHLDMVCEKNEGTDHNFDTDPIRLVRDGDWIKAQGTTLGADNGVGVAAALAVMESEDVAHGPLELVFTIDEVRSMRAGAEQNGERSADVPRTSTSQSGGTRPGGDGTVQVEATTVANTAYKAFCDQTGHPYPEPLPNDPNYFYAKPEAPVLNVSYDDAAAFANWAGKRLPSAPEWDKARPSSGSGPAVAEWTSTAYTPSDADTEAFRKLAGAAPRGDWRVIKGEAPLPGLPSQSQPRGIAIGFRCVKDAARR